MDRVESASALLGGLLLPIGGIIFTALRRQTRPEVLQRSLSVSVVISFLLQIVNFVSDFSLIRISVVVTTLYVMITSGVVAGLGYALFLRWRQTRAKSEP